MTINVIENCEQFSRETKDEMYNLIEMTQKTSKEHGAALCENNGKIVLSNHCVGSKCAITLKKFAKSICPKDTTKIGSFHTHPHGDYEPSQDDILSTLDQGDKLSCIGTGAYVDPNKEKFSRSVNCHEIKNRELKRLGKELRGTKDKDKRGKIINSIVDIYNRHPYLDDILKFGCDMRQSNRPKRRIWIEETKKYVETFC